MGRPAYQITRQDFAAARRYIMNAMARNEISSSDGYMIFRRADTPELLQAWCDDYLPAYIFRKLKTAVIAARKRERDFKSKQQKKGIDLDYQAYTSLAFLAEDLGLSFSDTILKMEEAYNLAKEHELI